MQGSMAKFIANDRGLTKVSGLFIDKECPCLTAPLTEYAIMEYDKPEETPADFIKRYGAYPEDRLETIAFKTKFGGITDSCHIRAFTIGEAFNYIAWQVDGSKVPTHRILKFDSLTGVFQEVQSCQLILKPKEKSPEERAALQEAMRADLSKFLRGD